MDMQTSTFTLYNTEHFYLVANFTSFNENDNVSDI